MLDNYYIQQHSITVVLLHVFTTCGSAYGEIEDVFVVLELTNECS
jgi:hypothetical protein